MQDEEQGGKGVQVGNLEILSDQALDELTSSTKIYLRVKKQESQPGIPDYVNYIEQLADSAGAANAPDMLELASLLGEYPSVEPRITLSIREAEKKKGVLALPLSAIVQVHQNTVNALVQMNPDFRKDQQHIKQEFTKAITKLSSSPNTDEALMDAAFNQARENPMTLTALSTVPAGSVETVFSNLYLSRKLSQIALQKNPSYVSAATTSGRAPTA